MRNNNNLIKQNLSVRELSKILFDTLKDENGLAIKMIVREYNNKQLNKGKHNEQKNKSRKLDTNI